MAQKRPSRHMGAQHSTFWEYCNKAEFRLQKCDECDNYEWPPSPICSHCLRDKLTWTKLSGKGKIFTHCVFERQYYPECTPPWSVILVALEEGPWFVSNPKDIPQKDIKRGTPVKVAFVDCEDGAGQFKLPVFERA